MSASGNADFRAADSLSPEREAACASCGKVAYLLGDGDWHSDTEIRDDDDGEYLAGSGDVYVDAQDTPLGWCCSKRCRSQSMFDRADRYEQDALRRVRDACQVIAEFGHVATRVAGDAMENRSVDGMLKAATRFIDAIADDPDDPPAWCNRLSREEELEMAVSNARTRLERLASRLSLDAAASAKDPSYSGLERMYISRETRASATCAAIAIDLQEAV